MEGYNLRIADALYKWRVEGIGNLIAGENSNTVGDLKDFISLGYQKENCCVIWL